MKTKTLATLAGATLLLAACTGGEVATTTTAATTTTEVATTTGDTTTTTAGATTTDGGEAELDLAAFCETAITTEVTSSRGPDVDFESASAEDIETAMEEFSAELSPMLDELEANAPEELAEPIGQITDLLRQGLETGEPVFDDPAFQEAEGALNNFLLENCELETVETIAVDYAFEGIPETVSPGMTAFRLSNEGSEVHELILFRISDETDLGMEELLELPEDEAEEMAEFVGAAFAAPGEQDVAFVDLEPGRYGALCFIPVGTTSMEELPEGDAEPEAPPHFTQGMVAEFEVER